MARVGCSIETGLNCSQILCFLGLVLGLINLLVNPSGLKTSDNGIRDKLHLVEIKDVNLSWDLDFILFHLIHFYWIKNWRLFLHMFCISV